MQQLQMTIAGQVPSKSNCYRVISVAGHGSLAKTKALKAFEQSFFMQCPYRGRGLKSRFELKADVYYSSDRPDLDNALKVLLDCLQACKVIDNDRHCIAIVARKLIDKDRPRVELTLTEII